MILPKHQNKSQVSVFTRSGQRRESKATTKRIKSFAFNYIVLLRKQASWMKQLIYPH